MAIAQISLFNTEHSGAQLRADVRPNDIRREGCAVRVNLGITGGCFRLACGDEDAANAVVMVLRAVTK